MPRSFAWRMAAAAAAAMLLVSLATGAWVWWQAEASLRSQLDRALAAEAESLLRDLEPYGMQGLAEQVELTRRRRGPVLALLQAPGGQIIAGAMPAAPPFLRGYATLEAPGRSLRALGLVLPGGESTTHLILIDRFGLEGPLNDFVASGKPVLATCCGLILCDSLACGRARRNPPLRPARMASSFKAP